jgi:uncharacterized CHY-type Zn-finger protein
MPLTDSHAADLLIDDTTQDACDEIKTAAETMDAEIMDAETMDAETMNAETMDAETMDAEGDEKENEDALFETFLITNKNLVGKVPKAGCPKYYLDAVGDVSSIQIPSKDGNFKCLDCDFATVFQKAFKRHRHHHDHESTLICGRCSFSSSRPSFLKRWMS